MKHEELESNINDLHKSINDLYKYIENLNARLTKLEYENEFKNWKIKKESEE